MFEECKHKHRQNVKRYNQDCCEYSSDSSELSDENVDLECDKNGVKSKRHKQKKLKLNKCLMVAKTKQNDDADRSPPLTIESKSVINKRKRDLKDRFQILLAETDFKKYVFSNENTEVK